MAECECKICTEIVSLKKATRVSQVGGYVCEWCLNGEYVVLKHSNQWSDRQTFIAHKVVGLRSALSIKGDSDLIGKFQYID